MINKNKQQERELGFWETVRQNTHLKQFGTSQIAVAARIEGPITANIIEKALRLFFNQQPLLRARIERKNDIYFFELDRDFSDIPVLVIERHSPNLWKKIIEQELSLPPPTDKYLWKAVFINGKEEVLEQHELVLFFHHAIADGLSAAHAIKSVLLFCQQFAEGKTPDLLEMPLIDCVEKMLQKPLNWEEYTQQLQNYHPLPQEENWHYITSKQLGQRITTGIFAKVSYKHLLEKCRQESVTINSAIAAALIYSGFQKKIHKGPLSLLTMMDLRKFCIPPLTRDYLGCYTTGILTTHMLKSSEPSSFWKLAQDYQKELYESITKAAFTPYEFKAENVEKFSISNPLGACSEQRKPQAKESYAIDLCLTNLGLIDIPNEYPPFYLKEMYFCTSRQAGAIGCIVNVVSFPNEMFLCFGYAKPLLNQKTIKELLNVFLNTLNIKENGN